MKRNSPRESCPSCNGRDWLWNDIDFRWHCQGCKGGIVRNFNEWYKFAMDEWDTGARMLADFEREPEPDDARGKLIREARRMKVNEEFSRVDALAQVAAALRLMVDWIPHGRFNVALPEFDIEVGHEW